MTSAINTNGLDVNYPVPGVNNNSQGFRNNFTNIRTNFTTTATEITDLQNKVVVKNALTGTIINNDMANTLISNASTRSFRASTYNLGNSLSGTVLVNASLGDVQYGTVVGNVVVQFAAWAPSGTQSNVQLVLAVANANAVISFPSEVVNSSSYGAVTLENYANIGNVATVTAPANTNILDYRFSTLDCGNTITVEPFNRPRQSTQIQQRTPSPTGLQGDVQGTVAVGPSFNELIITSSNASDYFTTTGTTTQLYTDLPIQFIGTSFEANITSGNTYYVRNVVSSNTFTVSSTIGGGNVNLAGGTGNMFANPVSYMYVCTDNFDSGSANSITKTASIGTPFTTDSSNNEIVLTNINSLVVNNPIIFSGTPPGGIVATNVYYIKSIISGNTSITLSSTRTNGVAGSTLVLTSGASTSTACTSYNGSNIWKRISLTSW